MRQQLFTYMVFMLVSLSTKIYAAPPSVAVDIAPLHSLVSQVMGDVAKPALLIPAEASPHSYILRPSEAKALAKADLIFWIGESYTPWLEKALLNVASSAQKIEVLEWGDTITYHYREGATFESHDHGKESHHNDDENNKGHKKTDNHHSDDEQGGESKKGKESRHTASEEGHHDKHEGSDPHAWLDPENAKRWIKHIADILSKRDPSNASIYRRNATKAIASLDTLIQTASTDVDALNQPKFIVFHDAYQYFEKRFNIPATGAISLGHAQTPSPARIKEIRDTVKTLGVRCVFAEPQFNPGIVNNVFEGTSISTVGVIDPLGARLPEGVNHYTALIEGMVNSLSQCQ